MADEKKPSIYFDRTTIGSSNELDEYGVWIKSEPQVFSSSESTEFPESQDVSNLAVPEMSIPNLDMDEEIANEGNPPAADDFSDMLSIPDLEDEDTAEGEDAVDGFFGEKEPVEPGAPAEDMELAGDDASVETDDEIFIDAEDGLSNVSFIDDDDMNDDKDEMSLEDQLPADISGIEFDEDSYNSLSEENADLAIFGNSLEDFEDDTPELSDEAKQEGFTRISLEDFFDDTMPADISFDDEEEFTENGEIQDESLYDLSDINPEEQEEVSMTNSAAQEEKSGASDLSTQLLMRIADELSSIRSELSDLKEDFKFMREEYPVQDRSAQAHREEGQNRGFFDEEDDEKIALTGDELDNILNTAHFTEETGEDATEGLGDSFNFDDFNETVRKEAALKESFHPEPFPDNETPPEIDLDKETEDTQAEDYPLSSQPDIITDEEASESIFDEDAEGIEINFDDDESFDLGGDDFLSDGMESAESNGAEVDLESPEDFIEEDTEVLQKLRDEGVEFMTEPPDPEEEEFLAEDPHAALDEDIDMSQAFIEEPDLSEGIVENPIAEPSLDNLSIDLELEDEQAPDEISLDDISFEETPEEEEINLSMGGEFEPDAFASETSPEYPADEENNTVPEGFVVEAEEAQIPPISEEVKAEPEAEAEMPPPKSAPDDALNTASLPANLQQELKTVLSYMDQLLESLPDDKIEEFAKSEYFDTYKKLFKELGLT
ncbi:MAG: hypothetical protein LBP76_06785 [Treponema sp.]|jgi:hypothetical protein|nr:hypothetical protein [Treponema sp.]